MRRLLLVSHAPTAATRAAAFASDEPIDDATGASALAGLVRSERDDVLAGPARACRETASAAGLQARLDGRLADCDHGAWTGRTLDEIRAHDAAGLVTWLADPAAAPHGGETLEDFAARVAGWLDEQRGAAGRALAITHASVIRAALVRALRAPLAAFWQLDVAPLAVTELHARDARWTVTRVNCPLGPRRRTNQT